MSRLQELGAIQRLDADVVADPVPQTPVLRELKDYWEGKAFNGRLPARGDLDPVEMGSWLPHVILVDVQAKPVRFRWRLLGTHLTESVGRDVSGQWFDEIYDGRVLNDFTQIYELALKRPEAVRFIGRVHFPGGRVVPAEAINLPLAADGERVDMVLTGLALGADVSS